MKALEIDDLLAEGHASLAAVLGGYEWDWEGWQRECRRALELNPSYATARQWYAEVLAALGSLEEALTEIRRAQEVDPLSAAVNATAAWILYFAGQYPQAIAHCEKTIELHPAFRRRTFIWAWPTSKSGNGTGPSLSSKGNRALLACTGDGRSARPYPCFAWETKRGGRGAGATQGTVPAKVRFTYLPRFTRP